jgi:hypothetical protein
VGVQSRRHRYGGGQPDRQAGVRKLQGRGVGRGCAAGMGVARWGRARRLAPAGATRAERRGPRTRDRQQRRPRAANQRQRPAPFRIELRRDLGAIRRFYWVTGSPPLPLYGSACYPRPGNVNRRANQGWRCATDQGVVADTAGVVGRTGTGCGCGRGGYLGAARPARAPAHELCLMICVRVPRDRDDGVGAETPPRRSGTPAS